MLFDTSTTQLLDHEPPTRRPLQDERNVGTPIVSTVAVVLQPCQMLDWSDGLALGWGVAGVWLAAFAVLQLRRGAHE